MDFFEKESHWFKEKIFKVVIEGLGEEDQENFLFV